MEGECGYSMTGHIQISAEGTEFLGENCGGISIGRNGVLAWPTRSPDLNPLDFFLWGGTKSGEHGDGVPEGMHQSLEAMSEASVGSTNELGQTQCGTRVVRTLEFQCCCKRLE